MTGTGPLSARTGHSGKPAAHTRIRHIHTTNHDDPALGNRKSVALEERLRTKTDVGQDLRNTALLRCRAKMLEQTLRQVLASAGASTGRQDQHITSFSQPSISRPFFVPSLPHASRVPWLALPQEWPVPATVRSGSSWAWT
jgi:hypothetical protein